MNKIALPREPLNAFTHIAGIVLSVVGTIYIAVYSVLSPESDIILIISAFAFCASLIALYSASSIYHWSNGTAQRIKMLRKLDHAMIYVLIAGTYTPMLLAFLPNRNATLFVTIIWIVALVGIVIKLKWFNAPRILSTGLYVLMGWSILFQPAAITSMDRGGFWLLLSGGISYTIGGIIYALKKPNISKHFGFHELFHVFVILGSVFHYFVVVGYVI